MLASKYSEHVCNWTGHELSEVCNVDSEQVTIGNEVHHTHWKYNLLALRKQPWIQGNMGNISALQHILQFRVFLFGLLLTLFHCCLNQGYFEVFLGLFLGYTLTIGLFHTYFQRGGGGLQGLKESSLFYHDWVVVVGLLKNHGSQNCPFQLSIWLIFGNHLQTCLFVSLKGQP